MTELAAKDRQVDAKAPRSVVARRPSLALQ